MISVVGSASAAATSVAIPAHQPGDMILIFVRRASNTIAGQPAAGGTVPNWFQMEFGGANTLSLVSAYTVATASNHTTGAWASASHIAVLVLRSDSGSLAYGTSASGNASAVTNQIFPALALSKGDGTSFGVRVGTRTVASSVMATAPTNWINRLVQPAGASALLAAHTRVALPGNPAADTVTGFASAAYRAHTIEITETPAAVPTWETSIDDFNRADGRIDAGAGAALWIQTWLNSTDPTDMNVIGNQAGNPYAFYNPAHTKVQIDNSGGNCDILIDCAALPVAPNNEFSLWCLIQNPGTPTSNYYGFIWAGGTWLLRRYANGANAGNIITAPGTLAVGDTLWFSKRGSALKCYRRPSGGSFLLLLSATDANHNPPAGTIGIETSDASQRWDNLRGGPLVGVGPPPSGAKIVSVV